MASPGLSALGHGAQAHNRCSINGDLTRLSIKRMSTSSLILDMSGKERSVFSIRFKDTYLWANEQQKITEHYRCFWGEDAVYIKIQYILTTTAVSWRSLNIPAVHSNCWVMWIQQKKKNQKNFYPMGFSEKYIWKLAQSYFLSHLPTGMDKGFIDLGHWGLKIIT